MILRVGRAVSVQGQLRPPSDKSLTHRAFMLGAIASGESMVKRPLTGEDAIATIRCLEEMGAQFEWHTMEQVRVCPAPEWEAPAHSLDCGNSGTSMRLLAGLIASRPISATLIGDESLSKRPMKRIAEPLRLMGATLVGDTPPLHITGGQLQGISYESPVASAQIKSAILLAGLRAEGETWVREPAPSRDHTERMLSALGVSVTRSEQGVGVRAAVPAPFTFTVPGDISSAAFLMVAAAALPDSKITFTDVSVNPTRTGVLDVLRAVGASVTIEDERLELGEPVANVIVRSADLMQPFQVAGDLVPRLIDEIPVLAVLASQCDGVSTFRDARELRVKESDRIEVVASGLRAMGAEVETFEDGMSVAGPCRLRAAAIHARGDHRIGMAFAIAGLLADGETVIDGSEAIQTSYPEFERHLWGVAVY
jgi:3-phosphoshikimate 1-carboxyvinyltransferase